MSGIGGGEMERGKLESLFSFISLLFLSLSLSPLSFTHRNGQIVSSLGLPWGPTLSLSTPKVSNCGAVTPFLGF